jgi:glyoxylase-like metal-dependent hydrolase (beta-lactamase superfamily II)
VTRTLLVACLAAALLSLDLGAQDAASVIDAAVKAMGTTGLQSMQYTGTGTNNSLGQAAQPGGPWPRFRVTKYLASIDYAGPVMRTEVVRIDSERPPRGGGAGPFNPQTGQGGIRPIPGDIIQNQTFDGKTENGALNIWLTPHGFLKGAAAHSATAKVSSSRGRRTVSFSAFGKYTVTGTLNGDNLVEHVETRMYNSFTGDTLVEGDYSDYRDVPSTALGAGNTVKFPMKILMKQGGHPTLELAVAEVTPNSPAAQQVQADSGRGGGAAGGGGPQIKADKIADGVWFMTFGAPQTILVEFSDHVALIEGPTGDDRSMATIAEVRRMLPNKPIKYLVNTHHHSDHAGGIRAYVAEGIPIISHETQRRYYEQQIFRAPHTLNPDRLARAPKPLVLETMRDRRVLTDGTRTLELHHVRGNLHSEGLLMAYLPKERILIQADTFAPRPGVPPLPAPSPYTINLVENIERLKLDVERVVHVHGGSDPIATVRAAAGRVN